MEYQTRSNNHTFRLNTAAVIAIVAVCIALVLSSYFGYRQKLAEAEELRETTRISSEMLDKLPAAIERMTTPPAQQTPAGNVYTAPQRNDAPPNKLPPVSYP